MHTAVTVSPVTHSTHSTHTGTSTLPRKPRNLHPGPQRQTALHTDAEAPGQAPGRPAGNPQSPTQVKGSRGRSPGHGPPLAQLVTHTHTRTRTHARARTHARPSPRNEAQRPARQGHRRGRSPHTGSRLPWSCQCLARRPFPWNDVNTQMNCKCCKQHFLLFLLGAFGEVPKGDKEVTIGWY